MWSRRGWPPTLCTTDRRTKHGAQPFINQSIASGGAIGDPNLILVGQRFDVPALSVEELQRLLHRLEEPAA